MNTLRSLALASLSATALLSSAIAAAEDRAGWPSSFTVGTASQGGTYFAYGSGWANFIAEQTGVSGGAEVTGGPVQNMALVHTGDLAFGFTTMGPARDAIEGKSPLAPGMPLDNTCAMFPMFETPFSMAALGSSGVKTISDIPAGTRIGFGPSGSTSDSYFPRMMETLGVQFEPRNGSWADLGGQMQDGLLDMVGFAAGIPVPTISQLEVQTAVNVISFTQEEADKLVANFPVSEFTIPAGTYGSAKEDVRAVAMWNFAVANCDLPESFVYEVTRLTMENNPRMVSIHQSAVTSIPENRDKNTFIPWHPGAARWFAENGYELDPALIK